MYIRVAGLEESFRPQLTRAKHGKASTSPMYMRTRHMYIGGAPMYITGSMCISRPGMYIALGGYVHCADTAHTGPLWDRKSGTTMTTDRGLSVRYSP